MATNVQDNIFLCSIPQELLDTIVQYLQIGHMRNLALTCKNLHKGVIPSLYDPDEDLNVALALQHAACQGNFDTLDRLLEFARDNHSEVVNRAALDDGPGFPFGLTQGPLMWLSTTPLVLAVTSGQPAMAKKLLDTGADANGNGSARTVLSTGKQLRPINWVLDQMTKVTDANMQQQWKEILELLLQKGASVYPSTPIEISAIGQSIHHKIPLDITRILVDHCKPDHDQLKARFMYELGNAEKLSAHVLAVRELPFDRTSVFTTNWKRLEILHRTTVTEEKTPYATLGTSSSFRVIIDHLGDDLRVMSN
ncbi:hypothetical protein PG995_010547 [Apiospora arundinis]